MGLVRKLSYSLDDAEAGLVPEHVDYSKSTNCDAKYILTFLIYMII